LTTGYQEIVGKQKKSIDYFAVKNYVN